MTPIAVTTTNLPKYLFASEDGTQAVVVTMDDVALSGTPLVTGGDDEGDDMLLVGRVDDSFPQGPVDLSVYSLPPEVRAATSESSDGDGV